MAHGGRARIHCRYRAHRDTEEADHCYQALVAEGMQEMAFEAVVLRHPEVFTADAVKRSKARLAQWQDDDN